MAVRFTHTAADDGTYLESIAREVAPQASLIAQRRHPLLAKLMERGVGTIQSTKFETHDYPIRARTVTSILVGVSGDTTATAAQTSLALTSGHGARLRVGDQLSVAQKPERLQVTAVSTDTITVVRGFGGTTAGTIPAGTTLTVQGNAALEGAAYADSGIQSPTVRTNYSQIFVEGFELSGTVMSLTELTTLMMDLGNGVVNAGTSEYNKQLAIKLGQLTSSLAGAVWNGVAVATYPGGSSTVRRSMNGVVEQIREGNAAGAGAIYTDINAVDFNSTDALANLETFMKNIFDVGGTPNELWMPSRIARQMDVYSETTTGPRISMQGEEKIRKHMAGFVSSFGEVEFYLDPHLPDDTIVALDSSKVKLVSLPGREFKVTPMAIVGDSQRFQIVGEYSVEVEGAAVGAHAVGYNAGS